MSVDQERVVDFVTVDPDTKKPVLVITDHLSWEDIHEHLFVLQEKLNAYFCFIESGELVRKFPQTEGQLVTIDIALKHDFPKAAAWFFERAAKASEKAGINLIWRVFP